MRITSVIVRCLLAIICSFAMSGCSTFMSGSEEDASSKPTQTEPASSNPEHTDAYQRAEQSPGFFRMRLGKYLVTALYDGSIDIHSMLMKGRPQSTITRLLMQAKQPREVKTAVNAYLLDDGERIVLVDTGASEALGASMGKLRESLALSGYPPESVQTVLLTHLHPDHAGGLLHNGTRAFPNAQVYLSKAEGIQLLSSTRNNSTLPVFQGIQKALAPYLDAGLIHVFDIGAEPVSGIESVALSGHSAGLTGYRIRSGGESLLIWGDIVQSGATQFADPSISLEFDHDQQKARLTRLKAMREAAQSGEWIAGAHLPFPGLGRVQMLTKTSFRWLPIDYTQAMSEARQRRPMLGK